MTSLARRPSLMMSSRQQHPRRRQLDCPRGSARRLAMREYWRLRTPCVRGRCCLQSRQSVVAGARPCAPSGSRAQRSPAARYPFARRQAGRQWDRPLRSRKERAALGQLTAAASTACAPPRSRTRTLTVCACAAKQQQADRAAAALITLFIVVLMAAPRLRRNYDGCRTTPTKPKVAITVTTKAK
jgi:hypothetical protein